jgi:hypothetical protein
MVSGSKRRGNTAGAFGGKHASAKPLKDLREPTSLTEFRTGNSADKFPHLINNGSPWVEGSSMSAVGKTVVGAIAGMALIPLAMGAIIFAPVYVPLAPLCALLESRDAR